MANDAKWVGLQKTIFMFKEKSGEMLLGTYDNETDQVGFAK